MSQYPKMMYLKDATVFADMKRGFPGDQQGEASRVVKNAAEEKAATDDGFGFEPPVVVPR